MSDSKSDFDMKVFLADLRRRKAWEAAHPGLAEAWTMALIENAERDARQRIAEHQLQQKAEFPDFLRRIGVPTRVVEAIGDGLGKTHALRFAREFLGTDRTFLVLSGAPGVGKTVAACEVFRVCQRRGMTRELDDVLEWDTFGGLFVRASQLARLSKFGDKDVALFEKACSARVLVVDDVGVEAMSDFWREKLEELVDRRYSERRRTVLTTNLSLATDKERPVSQFALHCDVRVFSRLQHDGMLEACGAISLRKPEVAR